MLIIKKEFQDEILKHAQLAYPSEVCGILAGRDGRVEKVYNIKNVSDTPELCYLMDPKEQIAVMKETRNLGLEMLAIYHSHPGSEAYPSARDIELAFYPDAAYVIVSLRKTDSPEMRAFKIVEGKITKEEINIV